MNKSKLINLYSRLSKVLLKCYINLFFLIPKYVEKVRARQTADGLASLIAWVSCTMQEEPAAVDQELLLAAQKLHDEALLVSPASLQYSD